MTELQVRSEENKIPETNRIAQQLIDEYFIFTYDDTKEMFGFSPTEHIWKPIETDIRRYVAISNKRFKSKDVEEIVRTIKNLTGIQRHKVEVEKNVSHLNNGWWELDNNTFTPHPASGPVMLENGKPRISLFKLPHTYDPSADNPKQKKFFSEVVEEKDLATIQKIFGLILLPDQRFKKAILLLGPKDAGKGTFIKLVEAFAGKVSHVGLHEMADRNSHLVVPVTESIVNTTQELPKYKLDDVSFFTSMIGDDEQQFKKIFEKPFNARVRSKFFLATNRVPQFEDMPAEFIGRWIVLEFNNVFIQGEGMVLNLIDQLTTPEEMSGLINFALEGVQMLEADGFVRQERFQEISAKWNDITSKINLFRQEALEEAKEERITPEDLFEEYCEYVKTNGGDRLGKRDFFRECNRLWENEKKQINKERKHYYIGVTTRRKKSQQLGKTSQGGLS